MRTIILSILLVSVTLSNAQTKEQQNLFKLAKTEYNQLRYSYAIPLLKEFVKNNKNNAEALSLLANSYSIVNQYDSAIKYYSLAKTAGADVKNKLAEAVASTSDYDKAIKMYAGLEKSSINNARQLGFKNIGKFKNDSLDFNIKYLAINTPFNEFAVLPYNGGIVFESNRATKIKSSNEFGWDGTAFTGLFYSNNLSTSQEIAQVKWLEKTKNMALSELTAQTANDNATASRRYDFKTISYDNNGVVYFNEALNSKYNAGAICFTADSSTAYFTRNQNKSKGIYLLEIWSAKKQDGKWSNFTKLSFNNNSASYFHPALSKDEKRLYFTSDQEGGMGGTDIYYANLDLVGNWSSPVNMGAIINTAGNEMYPTVSESNLYFSSNGHPGLGGLDIYQVVMNKNEIATVQNLGYPLNSAADDMSFTKIGKSGYFSSNRYGSDDIFAFDFDIVMIPITGKVNLSNQSNAPIKVNLYAVNGGVVAYPALQTTIVDANGNYSFRVRPNRDYQIEAIESVAGNKVVASINSNNYIKKGNGYQKDISPIVIAIPEPVIVKEKPTFKNIIDSLKAISADFEILHHDFDMVRIEKSHKQIYNRLIAKIKQTKGGRIVVVSAADCKGTETYNEKLSARRATYITKLISPFSKKNTVVSLHVGENILAEPCEESDNKDKQLENRYTYVFIQK